MLLAPRRVAIPVEGGAFDITLEAGARIEGRVLDPAGEPLAGAAILSGHVREESLLGPAAALDVLAMSEADGSFHLHGVPPEGLPVTCSHPDFAPLKTTLLPDGSTLKLAPGARLSGVVRGADGQGRAGVPLLVSGPEVVKRTTSGPGGVFRVGGLAPGTYQVERADTGRRVEVAVEAGGERRLDLR